MSEKQAQINYDAIRQNENRIKYNYQVNNQSMIMNNHTENKIPSKVPYKIIQTCTNLMFMFKMVDTTYIINTHLIKNYLTEFFHYKIVSLSEKKKKLHKYNRGFMIYSFIFLN